MDVETERIRVPPVTIALIALCVFLFISLDMSTDSERLLSTLGVYISPFAIWDGSYSTLLGASWVHIDFFHLAICCAGLWFFGSQIEYAFGSQVLFGICFFASILSMGAQLLAGAWPSIGATGVVFALFGVIAGAASSVPRFAEFLTPLNRRICVGSLMLCMVIGFLGIWPMGNPAHLAGLVFGLAVAQIFVQHKYRVLAVAALLALVVGSVLGLFYMPWNPTWVTWNAIRVTYGRATDLAGWRMYLDPAMPVNPETLNNEAYQLATSPVDADRDAGQAVTKARVACAVTNWNNPGYIDTLAAAYAESSMWKEAQASEQIALAKTRVVPSSVFDGDKAALDRHTELLTILTLHLRDIAQRKKIRDPIYLTGAKPAKGADKAPVKAPGKAPAKSSDKTSDTTATH